MMRKRQRKGQRVQAGYVGLHEGLARASARLPTIQPVDLSSLSRTGMDPSIVTKGVGNPDDLLGPISYQTFLAREFGSVHAAEKLKEISALWSKMCGAILLAYTHGMKL